MKFAVTVTSVLLGCLLATGGSWACSCMRFHPQEHYCTADFVALVGVTNSKGSGVPNPLAPRSHGIELLRLFRGGPKAMWALAEGLLWTPGNDGLCGVSLHENVRYLVTGSLHGAKPWVSACGFVRPWNSLTRKQRKGFQRLYQQGCRCSVRLQPGPNTQCEWETAFRGVEDCQEQYAMCVPQANNGCTWLGGTPYRNCLKRNSAALVEREEP
ncbi:unnamed protein product [Ixodes pacificus]